MFGLNVTCFFLAVGVPCWDSYCALLNFLPAVIIYFFRLPAGLFLILNCERTEL